MTLDFRLNFTLLKSARVPKAVFTETDLRDLAVFVLKAERVAGPVTLALDLTGHDRIQALNRRFRGVDRTTDVISFKNSGPKSKVQSLKKQSRFNLGPWTLDLGLDGDIAINVAQAAEQAKKIKHSLPRELRLLWIHGILHLLDYTDYDPAPRRKMFQRQNQLLRQWEKLRLPAGSQARVRSKISA